MTADDCSPLQPLPGHDAMQPQNGRNAWAALQASDGSDPEADVELAERGHDWAMQKLRAAGGPHRGPDYGPLADRVASEVLKRLRS